ncbi:hypothetical protein [Blautia sp.]|uniref:hypothetical protein n=1 Tax=Blautia sp. TaxID=1955243 RepID=UPI002E773358|nr:hypothetical protein [Blautia sp.]MEE0811713.1 hypothetical protein [Blautia sp.]
MNPRKMMELARMQQEFKKNHPKVFPFLKAASEKAMQEGSIIDISVTTPAGEVLRINMKVRTEDLELLKEWKNMREK